MWRTNDCLRSRRQELHTKIAQILEVNFAETVRSQPEMLAHHYTEVRQPEQAVNWRHRAGLRMTQTAAYSEALDQLNCALAQLALLPELADRDRQETKIRTDLATPLVGIGGYASEATRANFERKVALYERTKEDALFPLLRGELSLAYGGSYMIQAVTIGEQLFAVAEKTGERGLRLLSRWLFGMALMGGVAWNWPGNARKRACDERPGGGRGAGRHLQRRSAHRLARLPGACAAATRI